MGLGHVVPHRRGDREARSSNILAVGDVPDRRRLFQHAGVSAVDRVRGGRAVGRP